MIAPASPASCIFVLYCVFYMDKNSFSRPMSQILLCPTLIWSTLWIDSHPLKIQGEGSFHRLTAELARMVSMPSSLKVDVSDVCLAGDTEIGWLCKASQGSIDKTFKSPPKSPASTRERCLQCDTSLGLKFRNELKSSDLI